ncbi:MAG: hypothetical protein CME88_10325 [Hirschia sp.]|nr:hypothetical protein [Hirschia sp.]MBF18762.1 hypothetical protein [Hirschia sp.]|tara:strand:- start:398 stop:1294 length:897 start_codon:yes stop_codon:yes gene_type:complete
MGFDATGGKPFKSDQDGAVWYAVVGVVVIIAFAAAFIGPKLLGGGSTATIEKLVKGRSVPEAAGLINAYGFKDPQTQTFLSRLQSMDSTAHAELLTDMARAALKGADRQQLASMLVDWSQNYTMVNAEYLRHSDPRYIDKMLPLARGALTAMNRTDASLCELDKMMRIGGDPDLMHNYTRYGGPLYNITMEGNSLLVGMVSNGRKRLESGESETAFAEAENVTEADKKAVAAAMMSLMGDPDVQTLMMGAQSGAGGMPENVNVCSIGSNILGKFEGLDPDVRQRIWTSVLSGKMDAMS